MNQKRPVNLELSTLHFPIMAITSILHRLSGIAVFLLLPFMLYLLQQSLHSPESFASLQTYIQCNFVKFLIWGFISSLFYHFMAGVRHMIADLGYGETVDTARKTAVVLLVFTVVSTIGLGVWIW